MQNKVSEKLNFKLFITQSLQFIKPFKLLLLYSVLLTTLFSILSALSIALIKPIFAFLFDVNSQEVTKNVTQNQDLLSKIKDKFYSLLFETIKVDNDIESSLYRLSFLLIGVFVIKNIIKYISSFTNVKLEENIVRTIRENVFAKLTNLSVEFFNNSKQGYLISTITNDVSILNGTTISAFTNLIRDIVQIIIFILLLISISAHLTLIAFSTSILSLLIMKFSVGLLRKYATRMQKAMSDYTSTIQETISGIRVVKSYNGEEKVIKRFENDSKYYVTSAIKLNKINALIPAINEVMAITAISVVIVVGGRGVLIDKTILADDLMTFLFALFAIMTPITLVINTINNLQRGIVAGERIFSILNTEQKVVSGNKENIKFENAITVKDLKFAYNNETLNKDSQSEGLVLKNTNITIQKGQKVAFVGSSGSGKSTLLDLIIRFYDPSNGQILIDNEDIKNLKIEKYRELFGIVSQDNLLFNDTIENNIKFANDNLTEDEIIEFTKIANAFNFIDKLPNKLQTLVGDKGANLSGGERQRIAIARALARKPEILIFDEATSALDAESEKIVQAAINNALVDKTAIIVAHRLSTIINCDVIFVFDKGYVVEFGNHEELISKNGIYKKLYEIQYLS
jgi:ABC-type multidrug transport system fused ATPase/permease subunit